MCGRFTLSRPVEQVAELFGVPEPPAELRPRYNIAPSQPVPVVGLKQDGLTRGLAMLKWGFVPAWSDDPDRGIRPSNARADSLHKPMFRSAFERQRCLIAADGFYEWRTEGKKKLPYHFSLAGGRPFAFAGLWSFWTDGSRKLTTCCLVTTDPNDVVVRVHNRMPVILRPEEYAAWLDAGTPEADLKRLLRPYPAGDMRAAKVGTLVNKPEFDGPELLTPAA